MIHLKGINKSFQRPGEGRLDVLNGVDLQVELGELLAIVGPSGSGKSTLMNILGLLDRPDSGEYRLNGQAVSGLSSNRLARLRNQRIGFVFQQFHLLPRTTALENVMLPLIYRQEQNGVVQDPEELASIALCQVGLEDRVTHYPSELSGGQQQRVAIARALVTEPDLILADEPTGNLDKESSASIMDLFRDLHLRGGTIVFITHDEELSCQASRVVRIDEGRLIARRAIKKGGVS